MAPARRRRAPAPAAEDVRGGVERILADERVIWFPVKHYSPACARQVQRLVEATRPAAVLVEGPDDASDLIDHLVHRDTAPPLTIFSAYVDHKDRFGLNGTLSPSADVPARFRSWWPMADFCPEYTALVAGRAVGAELAFIDLPVPGRIPFSHARRLSGTEVVGDHHLATSAYFDALARKQRRRDFEEFWRANFERPDLPVDDFRRRVLTFAWCARYAGSEPGATPGGDRPLDRDGTLTRERHMRWHIDRAVKAHPGGRVVVVTGAFHSVALPFTRGGKAKFRLDKGLTTVLTPYSFTALARLYHMARTPGYEQTVWEAMRDGVERPYDHAAMTALVRIMRAARETDIPVSTADAVGAWHAAGRLAALRGNREVTAHDLLDACRMGYVKGDARLLGGAVARAARAILVGHAQGHLTPEAGVLPLLGDFHVEARRHRLDLSGAEKTARLDLHKQAKHRLKSAFLHRCAWLSIPMFGVLDAARGGMGRFFRGPDPITGADMHLITETWAIQWSEAVDDRLVELCDRGATIAQAAAVTLSERAAEARDDAAESSALLLQCARMLLLEHFEPVLDVVDAAIEQDQRFTHLVDALNHFVLLHGYHDAMATRGHTRLADTIAAVFRKAVRSLPGVARVGPDALSAIADRLLTLARHAVTFDAAGSAEGTRSARDAAARQTTDDHVRAHTGEAQPGAGATSPGAHLEERTEAPILDRALLIGALDRMAADPDTTPALRGMAFGVLHGFGAVGERCIAEALSHYLRGSETRQSMAGGYLDGVFQASRAVFMRSPRLLRAINDALAELDWSTFKALLPDLRRAFTRFIPSELNRIGDRVAEEIGLEPSEALATPSPGLGRVGAALDARIEATLSDWW